MDFSKITNLNKLKNLFIEFKDKNELMEYLSLKINYLLDNKDILEFNDNIFTTILENISDTIIDTGNEFEFEEILSKVEKELIQLYMANGNYDDCIKVAQHLKLLTNNLETSAFSFVSLIEASIAIGNVNLEKKLISDLQSIKDLVGLENIWFYLSRYFSKTDAKESLDLIDKLIKSAESSNDIELKYKLIGQVVTNYFYLGYTKKALDLIEKIKIDFKDYLDNNELARVYLEHNTVVLMHNIDKNEYVVKGNLYAKKGYKKLNDRYNYLMTCVNLADGYMGIGKLQNAEEESLYALRETEKTPGVNSKSIAALCHANILSCLNKNSVALYYYEIGIKLSKDIQHYWDVNYGKIWRMLTLSEMGEISAIEELFNLRTECVNKNFEYLVDLATCFIFISSLNINFKLDTNKAESLMDSVNGDKVPGIKAQIIASYILIYRPSDSKLRKLLDEMINNTLDCEGIKGRPQFIKRVIEKYSNHLNSIDLDKINTWIKIYVDSIIEDIKEVEEYYFVEFDKNPKLLKCNLNNCHGVCCYDGVYLSKEDEKNIKKFIEENKSEFTDLPNKFIVNGNWKNIIKGRKTATRNRTSNTEHYPKHFNKTICVFADNNGFCRLQSLATKLDFHPWKYKPTTCWQFPLTILNDGEIISPPKEEDRDPCCYDESYPGYIKFLPCGKSNESGLPWYKIYKQEIIWKNFLLLKNKL